MAKTARVLVKLRPTGSLAAAESRANLRPLHGATAAAGTLQGMAPSPTWFLADLPDGAESAWDAAHARVADQLGIAAADVLFAEPDLAHEVYAAPEDPASLGLAIGEDCAAKTKPQDPSRPAGATPGWHVEGGFSQLGAARTAVPFSEPRTRIAHIDTGYDRDHATRPQHVRTDLEHNFVDGDDAPLSAQDPNRRRVFDNSGHGTGTLSVLAGNRVPALNGEFLGGAPHADVVPLRIANRVVLFYTSAFAQAIRYAVENACDVVSISMGGLPSSAWNDEVNAAYEAGVCIVAAAGNNVNGVPTRHLVYPARYQRVIAACGVMHDQQPYVGLGLTSLEGNFGPDSRMKAALAAYTPNVPWAVFGCETSVRMNGEGTSAATPQIAAAVALWFERHKSVLPRDWRRIEAVRHALFESAGGDDPQHFGNGTLRANDALARKPALDRPKTPPDRDSFAFLRVLTGLGIAEAPARERMLDLELAQRWLLNPELSALVPDPEAQGELSRAALAKLMDALVEDAGASRTLRRHVAARYPLVLGTRPKKAPPEVWPVAGPACAVEVSASEPQYRRIRTYAVDPSLSARLDTAAANEVVLSVRWEKLAPGPIGEYLAVSDRDASGKTYTAVDLDDPRLLAQDGWAPAEGNAAFHQQMVYAVAMRTIEHFERALGRPVLWRPWIDPKRPKDEAAFVGRLLVQPHALHQANAYYSPDDPGLLFGYFEAGAHDPGEFVPGSTVYTCLSHDIIAHETTHAILDGMHRRFNEASNPDVLAMHEAFADIVALLQHFTIPEILESEIARTRGLLETGSLLGSLAVQFGHAIGGRGALRDAIGKIDADGKWTRLVPDPGEYGRVLTPHARGALLVAAVFDAFLAIYNRRIADLLRIYTGGSGVLDAGAIHPDLVRRLSDEAAKAAGHVLNMCIRALDYVPPVDITFGEYLRGIITADFDLIGDDPLRYRLAFVEAFRRRGLHPRDLQTLSVDTLRWERAHFETPPDRYRPILERLRRYADACSYFENRRQLFDETLTHRKGLEDALAQLCADTPRFAVDLGLDPERSFEVHEMRRAIRVGPDGRHVPQVIVALTQSRAIRVEGSSERHQFRGGSTLVVDLARPAISYRIMKRVHSERREERAKAFLCEVRRDPLWALLLGPSARGPFAALHALGEVGDR